MLEIVTPAATGDLTTLTIAKRELGVMDAAQDARISGLIREASDLVAQWCNRAGFGRETLRQTVRLASPADALVLQRDLGVAVSAVSEDGIALAAADYERGGVLLYRLRGDVRVPWTARSRRDGPLSFLGTSVIEMPGASADGAWWVRSGIAVFVYRFRG